MSLANIVFNDIGYDKNIINFFKEINDNFYNDILKEEYIKNSEYNKKDAKILLIRAINLFKIWKYFTNNKYKYDQKYLVIENKIKLNYKEIIKQLINDIPNLEDLWIYKEHIYLILYEFNEYLINSTESIKNNIQLFENLVFSFIVFSSNHNDNIINDLCLEIYLNFMINALNEDNIQKIINKIFFSIILLNNKNIEFDKLSEKYNDLFLKTTSSKKWILKNLKLKDLSKIVFIWNNNIEYSKKFCIELFKKIIIKMEKIPFIEQKYLVIFIKEIFENNEILTWEIILNLIQKNNLFKYGIYNDIIKFIDLILIKKLKNKSANLYLYYIFKILLNYIGFENKELIINRLLKEYNIDNIFFPILIEEDNCIDISHNNSNNSLFNKKKLIITKDNNLNKFMKSFLTYLYKLFLNLNETQEQNYKIILELVNDFFINHKDKVDFLFKKNIYKNYLLKIFKEIINYINNLKFDDDSIKLIESQVLNIIFNNYSNNDVFDLNFIKNENLLKKREISIINEEDNEKVIENNINNINNLIFQVANDDDKKDNTIKNSIKDEKKINKKKIIKIPEPKNTNNFLKKNNSLEINQTNTKKISKKQVNYIKENLIVEDDNEANEKSLDNDEVVDFKFD